MPCGVAGQKQEGVQPSWLVCCGEDTPTLSSCSWPRRSPLGPAWEQGGGGAHGFSFVPASTLADLLGMRGSPRSALHVAIFFFFLFLINELYFLELFSSQQNCVKSTEFSTYLLPSLLPGWLFVTTDEPALPLHTSLSPKFAGDSRTHCWCCIFYGFDNCAMTWLHHYRIL